MVVLPLGVRRLALVGAAVFKLDLVQVQLSPPHLQVMIQRQLAVQLPPADLGDGTGEDREAAKRELRPTSGWITASHLHSPTSSMDPFTQWNGGKSNSVWATVAFTSLCIHRVHISIWPPPTNRGHQWQLTYFPKAKHSKTISCPTRAVVSGNVTFRSAGYFLMGPEREKKKTGQNLFSIPNLIRRHLQKKKQCLLKPIFMFVPLL